MSKRRREEHKQLVSIRVIQKMVRRGFSGTIIDTRHFMAAIKSCAEGINALAEALNSCALLVGVLREKYMNDIQLNELNKNRLIGIDLAAEAEGKR